MQQLIQQHYWFLALVTVELQLLGKLQAQLGMRQRREKIQLQQEFVVLLQQLVLAWSSHQVFVLFDTPCQTLLAFHYCWKNRVPYSHIQL
ncbi:hypothetical protein CKO18_08885 [Rhodoferax fermentans]|uniref:Uncharacterized protein n=1 Tax=Rhodoferax fermentans TaxID=28066 RepID=A0A1T1ASC8_RHOFE|nr:hypothetical protein [Rhodoferax fermentans]OOV06903.1 hypothetical protein RF819_09310 [Rhodoferax fermentans]